ncbi:serine--tRNA ligase [Candidatus Nitrosotenuis uzonensis]|uniref:Serine--tRNA ligase n=1 Tax=Candidatus Nitrosotenuis uzonensis TaxID=1407055 RepID=V6AU04_9ARCH|nr:serine--tRNA ligase [Candidatus Nitrosotenuis uzonensis]CDI06196.1 Seryl-tRNA synthetase [Candidatus Nitrosotenuis uzonensis]
MLDPKIIKEKPEIIKKMLRDRNVEYDLDLLLRLDAQRRELIVRTDELRKKKNIVAVEIATRKKSGTDASSAILQMQQVSEELQSLEVEQQKVESDYSRLALTIPNLVHESVPIGPDESANKEVRRWGTVPIFDFQVRDHIDISQSLDLVDLERAAKTAGARFYYLKKSLVKLNHALIGYALDFLEKKGYTPVQPPYMINKSSMEGAIIADDFANVIYKVQDEDLFLIGTSEHAIAAMHSDEILDGKDLPIRYAGVSPCFRKEAGAHGRDQKGIFRVHQFEKVEQYVFARPEESWTEHERMLAVAEEFYQSLGIPYRVMLLSSGDLGKVSAKTYDIEGWMAGQNAYREMVSCSNCLDFQTRRLKIRFRDKTNDQTQYVHSLNSTLVATTRTLVAIMENFQAKDGHFDVPRPLQKYLGSDIIS